MARYTQFKVVVSMASTITNKRVLQHALNKRSAALYKAVADISPTTLILANPCGSVSLGGFSMLPQVVGSTNAVRITGDTGVGDFNMVKGAMTNMAHGDRPAILTLTGFYMLGSHLHPTGTSSSIISAGAVYSGVKHDKFSLPSATISAEVKNLKTLVNSAISGMGAMGTGLKIYAIEYAGWEFGRRNGIHIPN